MSNRLAELTALLQRLKLPAMAESVSEVAVKAARNGLSHEAFLHVAHRVILHRDRRQ